MVGMAGLEPANNGVKVRGLTSWRHPNMEKWMHRQGSNLYLRMFQSDALPVGYDASTGFDSDGPVPSINTLLIGSLSLLCRFAQFY